MSANHEDDDYQSLLEKLDRLQSQFDKVQGDVHAIKRISAWIASLCAVLIIAAGSWAFSMHGTVTAISVNQRRDQADREKLEAAVDDLAKAVNDLARSRQGTQ